MKKTIFAALLASVLILTSCGSTVDKDQNNCFLNLELAKKDAKKNKRDMLVFVTVENEDAYSSEFLENILHSEDFKKNLSKKFTVVHMDFSERTFNQTVVRETDSKAEQKKSEALSKLMQNNMDFVNVLNVQYTPSIFIFTQDEYFVAELNYEEAFESFEDFNSKLDEFNELRSIINEAANKTKKGKNSERLSAIDELFNNTHPNYRLFLLDLVEKYIELDKNDETGLLGKYLMAKAEAEAVKKFQSGNPVEASQVYAQLVQDARLTPEFKQQAYYMAGSILMYTGYGEFDTVMAYFQQAINVYPEGENVPMLEDAIKYLKTMDEQIRKDQAAQQEAEEALQ